MPRSRRNLIRQVVVDCFAAASDLCFIHDIIVDEKERLHELTGNADWKGYYGILFGKSLITIIQESWASSFPPAECELIQHINHRVLDCGAVDQSIFFM